MQIFVKTISGETITLDDGANTVAHVKESIEEIEGIPTEYQRLVFEGKELEDNHDLSYYKIQNESTIHLSMRLDGGYFCVRRHLPLLAFYYNVNVKKLHLPGYFYGPRPLRMLAYYHTVNKKICRKCYCRLPPQATRCRKSKCGRTTDIRPKRFRYSTDQMFFAQNKKYRFIENDW